MNSAEQPESEGGLDLGGGDEIEKQREPDEERAQQPASHDEWNYDGINYEYYGDEWNRYWLGPMMKKKGEENEPMFKVVGSPKSKRERVKEEKKNKV